MTDRAQALITGATQGIGLAVARALAPDYDLHLVARSASDLQELAQTLRSAQIYPTDLRYPAQIEALVQALPPLDVLINNAGVEAFGNIDEFDWQVWEQAFSLNVLAPSMLSAKALPDLRRRKGQIVMINSGAGRFSAAGMGAYSATKHALDAVTKALRAEELGRVRVIAVHPGRVDTPMQQRIQASQERSYRPADHLDAAGIANAVRFALKAPWNESIEEISIRPQN